jgi:hypothetical protein
VTVYWTGRDAEDPLTVVRATASAVWHAGSDGQSFAITGGDNTAQEALERCSLLRAPDGPAHRID